MVETVEYNGINMPPNLVLPLFCLQSLALAKICLRMTFPGYGFMNACLPSLCHVVNFYLVFWMLWSRRVLLVPVFADPEEVSGMILAALRLS